MIGRKTRNLVHDIDILCVLHTSKCFYAHLVVQIYVKYYGTRHILDPLGLEDESARPNEIKPNSERQPLIAVKRDNIQHV